MNTTNKGKKLYRYEIEYSNPDSDETRVVLRDYPVVSETDKTYLINVSPFSGKQKRVLKMRKYGNGYVESGINNRFAYLKKTDAMMNFEIRTKKRVAWYKYWLKECEKGLELIKEGTK